ncbi:MAG: hypothetical protein PHC34_05190 [Candidatus Gastranaerophilales bacterium]|nr:hypothetical protein [Candidatus Gastranaerophilales bacterium]
MEINFRNINLNNASIKNVTNKSDSNLESFNSKDHPAIANGNIPTPKHSTINVQFNSLTRIEQSVLIRELLNLPKEIKELLELLTNNNGNNKTLTKLINDINQLVMFSDIQKVLNTNAKDLINKLLKLIQPTPGNIQNIDQLKEIIGIIQTMIPSANMPNNEILKNIILLYLPWLPLIQPQEISIEYEKKKNSEEKDEDISLIIYITTENIGRLKGFISLNSDNKLNIQIESLNYDESIKEYLEIIHKRVEEEINSNKIPAKTEIISYKSKELKKSERREIALQPVSGISPKILMAAYLVTRVVFELDENISLNKKREKMIQEKS